MAQEVVESELPLPAQASVDTAEPPLILEELKPKEESSPEDAR